MGAAYVFARCRVCKSEYLTRRKAKRPYCSSGTCWQRRVASIQTLQRSRLHGKAV